MMLDLGIVMGAFGLLAGGVYFVGGRLIDRYYRASDDLEHSRNTRFRDSLKSLKELLDEFKKDLRDVGRSFQDLDKRFYRLQVELEKITIEQQRISQSFETFVKASEKRFTTIEQGMVTIFKEKKDVG
jgi:predicted  nucleic acid-binding Zn-ribbon protein